MLLLFLKYHRPPCYPPYYSTSFKKMYVKPGEYSPYNTGDNRCQDNDIFFKRWGQSPYENSRYQSQRIDGRPTYFVTFFLFHRVGMLFLLFQFIEEKVTYFGIQMMTGVATSYMVVFIGIYLSIELYSCFD